MRAVLLLPIVLALAWAAPTARAAQPGINLDGVPQAADVPLVKAAGAGHARAWLLWSDVEAAGPGRLDPSLLAAYDAWIDAMHKAGLGVILGVAGAPRWASGSPDRWVPPRRNAPYARFLRRIAERWRGKVKAYEIWNEADDALFWRPRPSVGRYIALLRASRRALRRADRGALLVTAPLTAANFGWVDALYRAGGRRLFDRISIHANTACQDRGPTIGYLERDGRLGRYTFLGYREVRRTMLAHGDRRPLWMTELGWSSTTGRCRRGLWAGTKPAGVGPRRQAAYLRQAYGCLAATPYLSMATWFTLRDLSRRDGELSRYGLLRHDGRRKPSWAAFRAVARKRVRPLRCVQTPR